MKQINQDKYIGKIYNRLTVLSFNTPKILFLENGKITKLFIVNCVCSCGNLWTGRLSSLRTGDTQSCGCLQKENTSKLKTTHGLSKIKGKHTKEYATWSRMKERCYNKNGKDYLSYGGRGIVVCDEWINDYSQFIKDMGFRPSDKHSLDRKDVNGNYEPNNCRWATLEEQANNKRDTLYINYLNKKQSLTDWCNELNLSYRTIYKRMYESNWTFEKAISIPIKKYKIKNDKTIRDP